MKITDEQKTRLRVFLSHKMNGLSEQQVNQIRINAKHQVHAKYGKEYEITFVDNYHHHNVPDNAGRLWHLGESIKILDSCNAVYFVPNYWMKAKGCWIERFICLIYKVKVLK